MLSLEEKANINNLIANCNDMINGKFILADYKILSILKNINQSDELLNLLNSCLTNFNFEKEFSKACVKNLPQKKFSLPEEPEKILAFVVCLLINIKNNEIDLDLLLNEFFKNPNGKAEEYKDFSNMFIVPFRNIIANCFDIPLNIVETIRKSEVEENVAEEKHEIEKTAAKSAEVSEEEAEEEEQEEMEKEPEEFDEDFEERDFEAVAEARVLNDKKLEQFFIEVKSICQDIHVELDADKKVSAELKEKVRYITMTLIEDCEKQDFDNTVAIISMFDLLTSKIKSIKFLTRELQKILENLSE